MKKLFLLPFVFLLLVSCQQTEEQQADSRFQRIEYWVKELPPGATEIEELSNSTYNEYWLTFRWREKKWLYKYDQSGHRSARIMVEIPDE